MTTAAAHPDYAPLQSWRTNRLNELASIQPVEEWWQFKLGEIGAIAADRQDLEQAIATILKTPRGSDVHRPEFASDLWDYIDYPILRATPFVVRDSVEAIELWEPRVALETIEVIPYNSGIETIKISLSWAIAGSQTTQNADITL